jgi:hypothetical protein
MEVLGSMAGSAGAAIDLAAIERAARRADPVLAAAEAAMIEAWQLLRVMPDRERAWLSAGGRTSWPEPLREQCWGMIDAELAVELGMAVQDDPTPPRTALGKREVAKVERAFLCADCLTEAVPLAHARLFMLVIAAKAGRLPGGFRWADIGRALYGRDWATARCDGTTDVLARRYEAALGAVGVRLALWEAFGPGEVV